MNWTNCTIHLHMLSELLDSRTALNSALYEVWRQLLLDLAIAPNYPCVCQKFRPVRRESTSDRRSVAPDRTILGTQWPSCTRILMSSLLIPFALRNRIKQQKKCKLINFINELENLIKNVHLDDVWGALAESILLYHTSVCGVDHRTAALLED